MNILSQDGQALINYNNAASIYIQKVYRQYANPDTHWEIGVMYPAVSTDVLCETIAKFDKEEDCIKIFNQLITQICEYGITFIRIEDLC